MGGSKNKIIISIQVVQRRGQKSKKKIRPKAAVQREGGEQLKIIISVDDRKTMEKSAKSQEFPEISRSFHIKPTIK